MMAMEREALLACSWASIWPVAAIVTQICVTIVNGGVGLLMLRRFFFFFFFIFFSPVNTGPVGKWGFLGGETKKTIEFPILTDLLLKQNKKTEESFV